MRLLLIFSNALFFNLFIWLFNFFAVFIVAEGTLAVLVFIVFEFSEKCGFLNQLLLLLLLFVPEQLF